MTNRADISRKRDILEKVVYALVISLLTCMGVHATGCGSAPAFAIGIHAAIASDEDLLPKTGGYSRAKNTTTTTTNAVTTKPNAATP